MNKSRILLSITLVLTLFSRFDAAHAQVKKSGPSYRIVKLSESPGLVTSLNSGGDAVGFLQDFPIAAQWTVGQNDSVTATTLNANLLLGEDLISFDSVASGINDQGIIVGALGDYATGTGWRPVVWITSVAAPQVLTVPLNPAAIRVEGEAFGVSNIPIAQSGLKAVVVGRYIEYFAEIDGETPTLTHAVAWGITADDLITNAFELGIGGGTAGVDEFEAANAVDINRNLTVVGSIYPQAMRWQLGWNGFQLSLVSTLALFPDRSWSQSSAINDDGDICGERAPYREAYLLDNVGGTLMDKPLAQLLNNSREYSRNDRASDINNLAVPQVVGNATVFATRSKILQRWTDVVWKGSSVIDLEKATPSLTLETSYLNAINDSGWIAGQGWNGADDFPIVLIPQ